MKKIFITTLLFFLALSILAVELDSLTAPMPKLKQGITEEQLQLSQDTTMLPGTAITNNLPEPVGNYPLYTEWYHSDFDKNPFDGNIEICPMGSPLPSPSTTLFLALGTLGIIYMCRSQSTKGKSRSLIN